MSERRQTQLRVAGLGVALLLLGLGCNAADPPNDGTGSTADAGGPPQRGGHPTGPLPAGNTGAGQAAQGGANSPIGTAGTTGSAGGMASGGSGARPGSSMPDAGVASGGCRVGAQSFPDGQNGIPAGDGCNTCTCHAGQLACTDIACAPDTCLVAQQLDSCCTAFKPALRSELVANECLVAFGTPVDPKLAQKCFEQAGPMCALVDCAAQFEPQSRMAAPNGMGGCRFSDECNSNEDCVLGSDSSACCACITSLPVELLASNHCLVKEGTPLPAGCPGCTLPVQCGMCPEPPAAAFCEIRDSFSVCR